MKLRFLSLWFRLPEWLRADAPLPIVEWVSSRIEAAREQLVIDFGEVARAFGRMNAANEEAIRAIENFTYWLKQMRQEHPDWFDPDTGYLLP